MKSIVTGRKRKRLYTSEIYLANSTGSCSVLIYSVGKRIGDIRYLQRADGEGRVVWKTDNDGGYPTIRMVTFPVADKIISTALPLTDSIIYTLPIATSVSINDLTLSPDGDEVFFAVEEADGQGGWLNSLNVVDVSNFCRNDCPTAEKFLTFPNEGVSRLAMNAAGDRIYFTSHDRIPDLYRVAFTERNSEGTWQQTTNVATSDDGIYVGLRFGELDAGTWPIGGNPAFSGGIIAFQVGVGSIFQIDVLHVEACTSDSARPSCLAAGLSPVIRQSLRAGLPYITSIPLSGALSPSLLIQTLTEAGTFDLDLETQAEVQVLQPLEGYVLAPAD